MADLFHKKDKAASEENGVKTEADQMLKETETELAKNLLKEKMTEEKIPEKKAEEEKQTAEEKQKKKKTKNEKKKTRKKVIVLIIIILIAAAAIFVFGNIRARKAASTMATASNTATVTRQDITSEISSSGTIEPKNTYSITALVSGEILQADFEEGDQVEEGQVLYVIDSSSMESDLNSANNSLTRSQTTYEIAQEDYNDAVSKYGSGTYPSTMAGFIKKLYIQAGDKVSGNTQIADIYNDQAMKIRVPFLSGEAQMIGVGNEGIVTITDTGEAIPGVVTAVSNMDETLSGGRIVRYVTMQVTNPGGLTSDMYALVNIGEFTSSQEGTFEAWVDTVMMSDLSSSVEVESLLVSEGDYVNKGTPVFRMTAKTGEELIRTYKDAMDQKQENVESAQSKLESTKDNYENYTITAPISGQVITKTYKVGDKIGNGSGNSASVTLATIYDLSSYTFSMSVDELDVQSVQVGMKVNVEADAFEGKTFSGTVTNISLESAQSNGVTNYPVTVTMDETYDFLPGMNVDGYIVLNESKNTLAIPADALMRGNRVYIKDDTVTEAQGTVPAGFRSVEVETGLISDDYVEIVSGVEEGDTVYVAESSKQNTNWGMMEGGRGGMNGEGNGGNMGGPGGAPSGGMR